MKLISLIKRQTFLFVFVSLTLVILSCHKEGTGGKSTVSGQVKHHSHFIPNALVFIKYGATDIPGIDVGLYDDHTTCDANGNYEIKNLRKGDYYLFGNGFDAAISQTVSGGIAVKLKYNKSFTTDVQVTE